MDEMCSGENLRLNASTPQDQSFAPGLAVANINMNLLPVVSLNFSTSGLIPTEEESRKYVDFQELCTSRRQSH